MTAIVLETLEFTLKISKEELEELLISFEEKINKIKTLKAEIYDLEQAINELKNVKQGK